MAVPRCIRQLRSKHREFTHLLATAARDYLAIPLMHLKLPVPTNVRSDRAKTSPRSASVFQVGGYQGNQSVTISHYASIKG
jgi:hypothetical protein